MDKDTLTEIIGRNITKYRKQAGMTQAQLAELIGVSTAFISRVERGQKIMKVQTLYETAPALHVSCDALLTTDDTHSRLENIRMLIAEQPEAYLEGFEKLIRVCAEEFISKDKDAYDCPHKE